MSILSVGDSVYVEIKEHRTDEEIVFQQFYGTIIEVFNAWSPKTGDRWQYKIKTIKHGIRVFHEGFDEGTIRLVKNGI